MNKTDVVRVRVEPRHIARLQELEAQTGLVKSEVVRRLIESAALVPTPMPVAQLSVPEKEAA